MFQNKHNVTRTSAYDLRCVNFLLKSPITSNVERVVVKCIVCHLRVPRISLNDLAMARATLTEGTQPAINHILGPLRTIYYSFVIVVGLLFHFVN